MTTKLERNVSRFDILKNLAEIIALLIGGVWAYHTFTVKDQPLLSQNISAGAAISINKQDDSRCEVKFLIQIKNIGKTSFVITTIEISYWVIPIDSMRKMGLFDVDNYIKRNERTAIKRTFKGSDILLLENFGSGYEDAEDFTYYMKPDDQNGLLFRYKINVANGNDITGREGHQWVYPIETMNGNHIELPSVDEKGDE